MHLNLCVTTGLKYFIYIYKYENNQNKSVLLWHEKIGVILGILKICILTEN